MKPTPLHRLLQLVVLFMALSWGDRSRAETPRKEAAVQPPVPAVPQPGTPAPASPPAGSGSIPESAAALAKEIATRRSMGDLYATLLPMNQLMAQWSPVGLTKERVIEWLGKPSSVNDKVMIYRFDHGEGGWQWEFEIKKGLISKVNKAGLE